MVGDDVKIVVVEIRGGKVRLGFEGPKGIEIHRKEVYDAIQKERTGTPCDHQWVSAVNEVVKSGEVCPKCGAIRP